MKALFKCNDHRPFLCKAHLDIRCASKDSGEYEDLNITLEDLKLKEAKSDSLRVINNFDSVQKEISLKVSDLLKLISRMHKKTIDDLNIRKSKFYEILKQEKFSKSDKVIIDQMKQINIILQNFEFEQAKSEIEKVFEREFIFQNGKLLVMRKKDFEVIERAKDNEEKLKQEGKSIREEFERKWNEEEYKRREENDYEKRQDELENRVRKAVDLEKRLKEEIKKREEEEVKDQSKKNIKYGGKLDAKNQSLKLKYLHSYLEWTSNVDDCFDNVEEIFVSNDEKYLFVYTSMMYSDKWLEIWNLSTKKLEGEWWTSCKHSNNKKNEKQELRRWIIKYPGCVLNTWVYSFLN